MKNFADWLRENDLTDEWSDLYRECDYKEKVFVGKDGVTAAVKEVYQYGGEGKGEEYYLIYSVKTDMETTFYKLEGWYASYDGSSFDDVFALREVVKKPVTREEWVEV